MSKIPYEEEPKKRGRKLGSKNKPGHNAGRPRNDNGNGRSYGVLAPKQSSSLLLQKLPPTTDSKPVYTDDTPKSSPIPGCLLPHPVRVAYDTPMFPSPPGQTPPPQAPTSGNGSSNGNGRKPRICDNPLPNLPAKTLPSAPAGYKAMESVCQAGLNPDLITPEELLQEIKYLSLSDIADWPDCPESFRAAPVGFRRSISSLQVTKTVYTSKDGAITETEQTKFTLWSKPTAHDQLMKWHGLYAKDKTPINAQFNQYNQMNISGWDLSKLGEDEIELLLDLKRRAVLDLEAQAG